MLSQFGIKFFRFGFGFALWHLIPQLTFVADKDRKPTRFKAQNCVKEWGVWKLCSFSTCYSTYFASNSPAPWTSRPASSARRHAPIQLTVPILHRSIPNYLRKIFSCLSPKHFYCWKMLHGAQCSCINASNSRKSLIFDLDWMIRHTGRVVYVPIVRLEPQKYANFFVEIFFSVRIS